MASTAIHQSVSGLAAAGHTVVKGVVVTGDGENAAEVVLRDGVDATGDIVARVKAATTETVQIDLHGAVFRKGVYVEVVGAGAPDVTLFVS